METNIHTKNAKNTKNSDLLPPAALRFDLFQLLVHLKPSVEDLLLFPIEHLQGD